MMGDLLGQLERSYEDRKGYWKGGKSVLKIGASMGTVINPFMKPESDEDFEKLRTFPAPCSIPSPKTPWNTSAPVKGSNASAGAISLKASASLSART